MRRIASAAAATQGIYDKVVAAESRIAINTTNTPGDADSVFRISLPGSYYLTGNVTTPPGKKGIEIASSDVTIDFNGFRVAGYVGCLSGIASAGSSSDSFVIRIGVVGPVSESGIDMYSSATFGVKIEDVIVRGCGLTRVNSLRNVQIRRVIVSECSDEGIFAEYQSSVEDCQVEYCNIGIHGVQNCTIKGNVVTGCSHDGINVQTQSVVQDNYCGWNNSGGALNTGAGIHVTSGWDVRVEGKHCVQTERAYGLILKIPTPSETRVLRMRSTG